MVKQKELDDGRVEWNGSAELTESQAYPEEFGERIAELWHHHHSIKCSVDVDMLGNYDGNDMWEDAGLEQIFVYIRDLST